MIWLSPMAGTAEGSVYFDMRDTSTERSDQGQERIIRGLLGDGQREIWAEVQLGRKPRVQILPLWTDEGEVETLSDAVDEELLKEQLLEAVQQEFPARFEKSAQRYREPSLFHFEPAVMSDYRLVARA